MKYKHVINNKSKDFGSIDLNKKIISVNKKRNKKSGKGELIDTIVHEEIHRKHPKMKERKVIKASTKVEKRLSGVQKHKMYGWYAK